MKIRSAVDQVTELYEKMKPETKEIEDAQMNVQVITNNTLVIASGVEESTSAIGKVDITAGHLQKRAEKLNALVE